MQLIPIKRITHETRSKSYDIIVSKAESSGEYQVHVERNGKVLSGIYSVPEEMVLDAKNDNPDKDLLDELIVSVKGDIDRNDYGIYS